MSTSADQVVLRRIRTVSSLGVLLDGYNLTIIAVALIPLLVQYHLGSTSTSLLASVMLIGSIIGGLSAGVLADRWGRKTLLVTDLVVFIVFSLVSALVTHYLWLIIARLVVGLAVGADYAISPTYLAEFSPRQTRGYQMGYMWLAWTVGAVVSYALGAGLVAWLPTALSWRVLFAVGVIPALVGLMMRARLPESPYWLAHRQTVRPRRPKVKSGSARTWALALLPWFFMDLATYGLGLLLPVLLKSNGFSSSSGAILGTGLAALFGGLGSLWALFRLDRVGRMRLQIWGFLLGGVGLLLLAALIGSGVRLFLVLISGIMVVNFLYGVGPGLTAGIVPAEIFPTTWRATGQGSATAFSRIGAVVGVFALGYFEGHGGFPAVLVATGVVSFLGVLSTWLFRIEPNQKPLPDMADSA